jgi:hypothetical protein
MCLCIASISQAQTEENTKLPELKGEWKLDSVVQKQGDNKQTALLPSEIIPDSIYYSCPVKIKFDEQARSCLFLYENEETKNVSFYVYEIQNDIRFHVSLSNGTPIPDWIFNYFLTTTQNHLILTLEHNEDVSDVKIQYEYFYSLIN